ncbi:hypothetical protein PPROV_000361500 [Pycnococcus provasolii]|uniref:EF-hand domain-containing protein n=1 Tax=Pycnococcus provasolii TaxID=41880 RepID=A0A830HED6_9CHLO|nr:hypothetical protein PPROV_000361500 [Pycnococcus provasolii]
MLSVTGAALPVATGTLNTMEFAEDDLLAAQTSLEVSHEGRAACSNAVEVVYRQKYLKTLHNFAPGDNSQASLMPRYMSIASVLDAIEAQLEQNVPKFPATFANIALQRFPRLAPRETTVLSADETEQNRKAAHAFMQRLTEELLDVKPDNPMSFLVQRSFHLAEEEELKEEQPATAVDVPLWLMEPAELREAITKVFVEYDVDKNGVLDRKELKTLLKGSEMNLSDNLVREILAEADENDDGLVSYDEFVPLMVDLISMQQAKESARQAREEAAEERRREAVGDLIKGMQRGELEEKMLRVFQHFDKDGNGVLSRKEFKKCLQASQLGFSRKEVNLLMSSIDANDDGKISYDEFIPMCFLVLVERKVAKMEEEEALSSDDAMQQILLDYFAAMDVDQTGQLSRRNLNEAIIMFSDDYGMCLSKAQVAAIAGEADAKADGMISYAAFVPVAAHIMYELEAADKKYIELDAAMTVADSAGARAIHGLPYEEVVDILRTAFVMVDADQNGVLTMDELEQMLKMMTTADGTKVELSEWEVEAVMSAVDTTEDGIVEYWELENFIFDVLHQLETKKNLEWREKMNQAAEVVVENNAGT